MSDGTTAPAAAAGDIDSRHARADAEQDAQPTNQLPKPGG